jgi:DNA mismatch endonuclease (patch repair protein)
VARSAQADSVLAAKLTSERMRRVRRTGTAPENAVAMIFAQLQIDVERHPKCLAGSPDFVCESCKLVCFVHGCFWHQHRGCSKATFPKTNQEFWRIKFVDNARRDRRVTLALRRLGYRVIIIWQCQTTDVVKLRARLRGLTSGAIRQDSRARNRLTQANE